MDPRETAIELIRRMPAGVDFDDILATLSDELYRIECEAFGIDPETDDEPEPSARPVGGKQFGTPSASAVVPQGVANY